MTKDGINFTLHGKTVKFLSVDDVIMEGDYIRDLVETGEEGGFNTTFKSEKWRGCSWHLVDNDFTAWIGKTYRDYIAFAYANKDDITNDSMMNEIIRIIE